MTGRYTGQGLVNLAIARAVLAADKSVTATSSATADTCMTIGPFGVDEGTFLFVCYAPYLTIGTTNLDVELWVDGAFSVSLSGHMAASIPRPGVTMQQYVALSGVNHTLIVKAFVDAGTGHFGSGSGATGVAPNATAYVIPA